VPKVKPGPYKWAIFYTWRPLTWGPDRWPNFRAFIGGWWCIDAWSDREYCALYDTKEEAEKEVAEINASDPSEWAGTIFVCPTLRRLGEEKVVSVIKAEEARKKAERIESDRRFQAWYDAENVRISQYFLPSKKKS